MENRPAKKTKDYEIALKSLSGEIVNQKLEILATKIKISTYKQKSKIINF